MRIQMIRPSLPHGITGYQLILTSPRLSELKSTIRAHNSVPARQLEEFLSAYDRLLEAQANLKQLEEET